MQIRMKNLKKVYEQIYFLKCKKPRISGKTQDLDYSVRISSTSSSTRCVPLLITQNKIVVCTNIYRYCTVNIASNSLNNRFGRFFMQRKIGKHKIL